MQRRHAEIAGGGIGGLVAATALARRGWTVRVHERHSSLRSQGFGLAIQANGVRVLNALNANPETEAQGKRISVSETRDGNDRVMRRIVTGGGYRLRISRTRLLTVLAERAAEAGVELCTSSEAATATPEGELILTDGRRLKADLVIATDGVNSRVAESLGLLRSRKVQSDGAMRLIIPPIERELTGPDAGTLIEWWSGDRRIIFGAAGKSEIYISLVCPTNDLIGQQTPIDVASWARLFPSQAELFDRIQKHADWPRVQWAPFQIVKLHRWSRGRVAIVGDAAHSMPPNMGQGGACTMMNALSLAVALEQHEDMSVALDSWEAAERPLTDHTQRWSQFYSHLIRWPRVVQTAALQLLNVPAIQAYYSKAARHIPTGTVPQERPVNA